MVKSVGLRSGACPSGRGNVATATVVPTVSAFISDGADIHATNSVSINATATVKADANSDGAGGGLVDVCGGAPCTTLE